MELERKIFPLLFVSSGSINVLLNKWSNTMTGQCSDGKWRNFQHPIVQTIIMFLGQLLCLLIYKIVYFFTQRRGDGSENFITRGGHQFSKLSVLLPSLLDSFASILLFTGLYLTYASSFQIIRVSALIFAGIFSAIHLNQRLIARHWIAFLTIACGVVTIISIDVHRVHYDRASLPSDADENSVLTGNLLVLCAQIIHAAQFVYEEKNLKSSDIPAMEACGWQGFLGLIITVLLAVCLNFLPTSNPLRQNTHAVFDDLTDIIIQLKTNPQLVVSLCLFVISSACYGFVALSIVKFSSTANRLLGDGIRIVFIWLSVLFLRWEYLNLISLFGFVILQLGVITYRNDIFNEWRRALLARLSRARYSDLSVDNDHDTVVPRNQQADII